VKQEVGDDVRPCFRVGRPFPSYKVEEVRDTCRNVLGGGAACGDKPLAFVGRSTRLLSGQDPLVSDLVARARSYSMRVF
jgi:hypothetical protein